MNTLFNNLPEGITILESFVNHDEQSRLLELCRQVAREAPFVQPTMPRSGTPFKLRVTSCGTVGWFSDRDGFRYLDKHPETHRPWAAMPEEFLQLAQQAAACAGEKDYLPDTCLINFYPAQTGRLGLHVDDTEEDRRTAIVTLSLGDSCIFAIGGATASAKPQSVQLASGDIVVMHGAGRNLYHGVEGLIAGTSSLLKNGGRISLTFRRARKRR
jgi:DNA oxidative demethylase